MGKIIKIALTGGPCGGKTEALKFLKNELAALGVDSDSYFSGSKNCK